MAKLNIITLGSSKNYTDLAALGLTNVVVNDQDKTISFTLVADGSTRTLHFDQPSDGKDGADGIGISKIEKIGTVDLVDTYRITFTDNSTFDYEVTNGKDGQGGTGASTWSEISDKPFESLSTDFSVENGELKVVGGTGGGEENVQSDWNETDDTADGFIKNKPTIPTKVSQLENDSNYLSSIPEEYVTETELSAKGYLTEHQDISGKVDKVEGKSLISDTEIARLASVDNYDDTDIKAEIAKKADATAIPSKVSELTNDSNYQTAEQVNSTVTTEIAKVVADAPEDLNTLKEMSDWIAGHENDASAMNSAISDNKTSITALQTGKADKSEIPTTIAELTDSADYAKTVDVNDSISTLQTGKADASDLTAHTDDADIHVTAENKATWNTVSDKVDKEEGKGLSANDYTNEEKALVGTIKDKINKTSIATVLDDTVTDEQVTSALLAKTELDKKIDKTSIATTLSSESTNDEVVGAKLAYDELQKVSSETKEQFATASGESITVNDSVDGKIRDLKLYGKSEQKQYSGKNLLNTTMETFTIDGVTFKSNSDGTYTVTGTSTQKGEYEIGRIELSAGNYKLLGFQGTGIINEFCLYTYTGTRYPNDIGEGVNFTLSDTRTIYVRLAIPNGTTINMLLKPMIVDTSLYPDTTYDDYEPYTGGIPSPNPNYPQEIKSVVNPVVKVCGENTFDVNVIPDNVEHNECTYKITDDNITINATGTDCYVGNIVSKGEYINNRIYIPVKSNTKYRVFITNDLLNNNFYNICDSDKKAINKHVNVKANNFVITTDKDTCYINLRIGRSNSVTGESYTTKIFVYELYTEQTATLPYTLNAIPVESGGNVMIDGQEYIADYVDIENKKLVRCVGENTNRITIWKNTSGGGLGWYDLEISNTNFLCFLCKQYIKENDTAWDSTVPCFEIKKNIGAIRFYDTQNKNITVELMYDLATPTTIDLTDEEVQAFKELSTYYPTTNVFVTSDQLNGYAEIKYPTTDVSGLASRNESRIAELSKDTGDKFDDVNLRAAELKMLGWTVPSECPIQNYVDGNQFIQKVGRTILNGTEDWRYHSDAIGVNGSFYLYFNGGQKPLQDGKGGYFTRFKTGLINNANMNAFVGADTIQLRVDDCTAPTSLEGTSKIKQWLSQNNTAVYYELATPITTTIDGNEVISKVNKSLSVIGKCKNLLNPTLQTTTINGVTCTNNGDGTYTLNGTASADTYFNITSQIEVEIGKKYKLCCTTSNDRSKYNAYMEKGLNGFEYSVLTASAKTAAATISVHANVQLNDILIKPMLTTDLSATYDDFVPYTGDGKTLTHDVAKLKNDVGNTDISSIGDGTVTGAISMMSSKLGGLSFSISGTTLSITDGTNTWTLEANS